MCASSVRIIFVEIFSNLFTDMLHNSDMQEQIRDSNTLCDYCEEELFTYYESNVARKKLQQIQNLRYLSFLITSEISVYNTLIRILCQDLHLLCTISYITRFELVVRGFNF